MYIYIYCIYIYIYILYIVQHGLGRRPRAIAVSGLEKLLWILRALFSRTASGVGIEVSKSEKEEQIAHDSSR